MLFNTLDYALFLPLIFLLYWKVFKGKQKAQNGLLLLGSYFFYACWDWRFMFLLLFSTLIDYFSAQKIQKSQNHKKLWMWISITLNIGFLVFFKYYNFFADSFLELFLKMGVQLNPTSLNIILPVGISFYTFHGVSYVLDVYHGKIKAENNIFQYALFVSFFPLLVAGPIERATHLLPQIKEVRNFNYLQAVDGLKQILWGLVKKVIIADNCAMYVNEIFENYTSLSGSTLLIGAVLFAFQIYGDFSGYSDIAIGSAKLFGIKLLKNFNYPYFSRDIAEFWRRWHISLSTWFRDYLYIPLGGSRVAPRKAIRNTFIIFLISGFWHGANWTFIAWGALNALYFLPLLLTKNNRNHLDVVASNQFLPSFKESLQMLSTFLLVTLGWVFFRSDSIFDSFLYLKKIFSPSLFSLPSVDFGIIFILITLFMLVEWVGRKGNYAIENLGQAWHKVFRYSLYYSLILSLFYFAGKEEQFIYFQF